MTNLQEHKLLLLEKIKNNCLVLSEAFLISDDGMRSTLGDCNEKPYENLYNVAKNFGSLNKVSLADYYVKTVK